MTFQNRPDGAVRFDLEQRGFRPQSDLLLRFERAPEQSVAVRSYSPDVAGSRRSAAPYFLATLQPGAAPGSDHADVPPPLDMLILAEASWAVHDRDGVRAAVAALVKSLRPVDRFQLACGDVTYRPLCQDWLSPGTPEAKAAIGQFHAQLFLGGLDLEACLFRAAWSLGTEVAGRRRFIVFVGRGAPSQGEPLPEQLERAVTEGLGRARARFFAALVGNEPKAREVATVLARATGGRVFDLGQPPHGPRDLLAWQLAGCPTPVKGISVRVDGARPEDLYFEPSWVRGRTLDIAGRTERPGETELEVVTERDDVRSDKRWKLSIKGDSQDVFVGRHWAQHRVGRLLARESAGEADVRAHVVALAQEWGLLTPHTAFLVLENEHEYSRYGIDRTARRQYWGPSDALPERGLPAEIVERPAKPVREISEEEFRKTLAEAQAALDEGHAARALRLLGELKASPRAAQSSEYTAIEQTARHHERLRGFIKDLGPHRWLIDRDANEELKGPEPSVAPLLFAGLMPGFVKDHPHAKNLLREVQPDLAQVSLQQLVEWIAEQTGLNIVVHEQDLQGEGIVPNSQFDLRGIRRMTLRNVLRHVLRRQNLAVIEEPSRLLVTSELAAGVRLFSRVYPVADIIQANRPPDLSLLVDPYLDLDRRAAQRIEQKLARPVSLEFNRAPLREVAAHLAKILDDNVLLDVPGMEEEGRTPDGTRVTAKWRDVPARDALQWILEPLKLDYVISGEALTITSQLAASYDLEMRIHSGRGLIFQLAEDRLQESRVRGFGGGGLANGIGGGLGGGFGGGRGGGGGFGGGGLGGFGGGAFGGGSTAPQGVGISESESSGGIASTPPRNEPPRGEPAQTEPIRVPEVTESTGEFAPVVTNEEDTMALITRTIAPNTWASVGGSGAIEFWRPTLDFAVLQTRRGHEQVSELLDSLRRAPHAMGPTTGAVPASPLAGPVRVEQWETDQLIRVIEQTIQPNHWETVGGPCSLAFDLPHLVLAVSATRLGVPPAPTRGALRPGHRNS